MDCPPPRPHRERAYLLGSRRATILASAVITSIAPLCVRVIRALLRLLVRLIDERHAH
jgi:hypothetical protein